MIKRVRGAEIAAVIDPQPDRARQLSEALGVDSFASLTDALARASLDAVDIIAPHHLHYDLAKEALMAGKHVFMDKPLATNVDLGRRLCDIAQREGRTLAICHNLLFHPASQRAAALVTSGILGRATHAHAQSSGWLDLTPWDFRLSREATGGGAWVDGAPHLVYLLESLLGPVTELCAVLSTSPSRLGGEDTASGVACFDTGAVATIAVGYADCPTGVTAEWPDGWTLGVTLIGTEGRLSLGLLPRATIRWQRKGQHPVAEDFTGTRFDVGFEGAFREFVERARGGAPLTVSPADSLRNLELIHVALGQR